MRKNEGSWCWVNFKYEGVPTFSFICFSFICGVIGNNEKFCNNIFDTPIEQPEKLYGVWMRDEPRHKTHTM